MPGAIVKNGGNLIGEQLRWNISYINKQKWHSKENKRETNKNRSPGIKFNPGSQEGCAHMFICTHLGIMNAWPEAYIRASSKPHKTIDTEQKSGTQVYWHNRFKHYLWSQPD